MSELSLALPQYDIGAEIGRGATGVVHAGFHRALGRDVAVKRLPAALAEQPDMRARFSAEARLLARLDHPHIVPVYDYVESDTACLLVLERLNGGTLWETFRSQGLSMPRSCAVVLAMLSGLHAAHQESVLHLDVKPQNVLFGSRGTLKVADFGIARIIGGGQTLATGDGRILGTPSYIAPEQVRGTGLSPATDVYAAATVLYVLLSGVLPYSSEGGALAVVYRHAYEDATPIAASVPPPLAEVVMRGLARDPAARPRSAEEFAVAVARAAITCFGPGWLDATATPVQLTPVVLAAATGADTAGLRAGTGGGPAGAQPGQGWFPGAPSGPPGGYGGLPAGQGAFPAGQSPVPAGQGGFPAGQGPFPGGRPFDPDATVAARTVALTPVQPTIAVDVLPALGLDDVNPASLVPVQQVVRGPRSPRLPLLAGVGAALLTMLLALLSPGAAAPSGQALELHVAGARVTGSQPVLADLSAPQQLAGVGPPGVLHARMALSVAGIPLGAADSAEFRATGGRWRTEVALPAVLRWVVGGAVDARVEVLSGQDVVGAQAFVLEPQQPPYLTLLGIGAVLLLLFVIAYLESLLRSLRAGRQRVAALISAPLLGIGLGVALAVAGAVLQRRDLSPVTLLGCAAAGIGTTVGLSVAARRRGSRPR